MHGTSSNHQPTNLFPAHKLDHGLISVPMQLVPSHAPVDRCNRAVNSVQCSSHRHTTAAASRSSTTTTTTTVGTCGGGGDGVVAAVANAIDTASVGGDCSVAIFTCIAYRDNSR